MTVKRCVRNVVALSAAVVGLSAVSAAAVTVTDTQVLTSNGQDFTFTFADLPASDGTGGVLTITHGQSQTNPGLYDGLDLDSQGNSNEFFEVLVEGTSLGTFNCRGNSGHTFISGCVASIDSLFSLDLALTPSLLNTALSDSSISVVLAFSNTVSHLGDRDEVVVSLDFAEISTVPLPMSGLLLGSGLLALGLGRQRFLPG